MSDEPLPNSEIILYQTEDSRTRIQCRFEKETVWLTQALISELFEKDVRTINEHLVNIFDEGELSREATIRKFRIVRQEGGRQVAREVEHYNLDAINRIVNADIEFAELRALQRKVMTMRDWIEKLDEFLKLSEHELLDHAGKITAEQAKLKAELEYDRYRKLLDAQPRAVDLEFDKAVMELKKLPKPRKPKRPKP